MIKANLTNFNLHQLSQSKPLKKIAIKTFLSYGDDEWKYELP